MKSNYMKEYILFPQRENISLQHLFTYLYAWLLLLEGATWHMFLCYSRAQKEPPTEQTPLVYHYVMQTVGRTITYVN